MTTHTFEPTTYCNTFGSHPPVLRIEDGDTVITRTIDAWGVDAAGNQVNNGSNPQTGPFYIEGAQPSDTLAVHLDLLTPNRDFGNTRSALAPHLIDPWTVPDLPPNDKIRWQIDRAANTATPVERVNGFARRAYPLQPMLGCLGVAPEDSQAISTATSGPFGGNMDYRGFKPGATVYFPVFTPGALFFLGDGHAIQGDGEIIGTGIETSFDVQFTVHLIKGKSIRWPRGENAAAIFTVGNARPMEEALQHATSEMFDLLQKDYHLDATSASVLMGMCVEYEIGNVFDPAYTIVCKLHKKDLV
jgi:amidase